MSIIRLFFAALGIVAICACASSKTETISPADYEGPPVNIIAILPSGVLTDAISLYLATKGFQVVPAPARTNSASIRDPEIRKSLLQEGVDALLVVQSIIDKDGRPRSATALLYSTESGSLVSGVTWENGHGFGIERSVTNEFLRVGHNQAAKEIVETLAPKKPR